MAEKSFGAKKIKLDGSGTPTIQSPGTLNLNAVNVAISTNLTVGGTVSIGGTLTYEDVTNIDSVGIITARGVIDAQGYINLAQKIIHTGDADTSIEFPSNDTIKFETAGNERLRITSAGLVGINCTPSKQLQVKGTDVAFRLESTAATGRIGMEFYDTSAQKGFFGYPSSGNDHMSIQQNEAADLYFYVNGGERLRIDSAGKIGVGQAPNTKVNAVLSAFAATGDDDASDWGANGIFQLDHSGSAAANNEVLLLGAVSGGVGQIASGFGFGRESTSNWGTYISFKTHSTGTTNIDELKERVRIDSSGNLLIGRSSWVDNHFDNGIYLAGSTQAGMKFMRTTSGSAGTWDIGIDTNRAFKFVYTGDSGGTGAEVLRITSGGKISQGGHSPSYEYDLRGTGLQSILIGSENAGGAMLILDGDSNGDGSGTDYGSISHNSAGNIEINNRKDGDIRFKNTSSETERLRIRNDGFVLIQATSSTGSSNDNIGFTYSRHNTSPYIRIRHEGNGSSFANHTLFHMLGYNGTLIGEIKQTGGGGVNYYSASDHRLKENVVDVTNAITRLKNLKPKRFNFKVNTDSTQDGFLAHELQEVVPEAVSGTKDEVVTTDSKANNPSLSDSNIGDPVYQGVDERRVVPLLTAALQEAIAKIETLEAEVAALKSS